MCVLEEFGVVEVEERPGCCVGWGLALCAAISHSAARWGAFCVALACHRGSVEGETGCRRRLVLAPGLPIGCRIGRSAGLGCGCKT